jgi:hypothetical protein
MLAKARSAAAYSFSAEANGRAAAMARAHSLAAQQACMTRSAA